ncbi:MAG TPA: ABC transporter substrate-binding protein [Thermomicrobiales bacterium]|nr:ABC transporter substrate-binding protein [Thermomicrobiales bacterium]
MNRTIRWVTIALLLALVGALLAACGDDKKDTPAVGQASPEATTAAPASPTTSTSASPAAPGETAEVSIALDWYPWSNHTGLYMAQATGAFADQGIDPNIYVPSDPTTALQLVAAGQDDFTISYQTDVLIARQQGLDVVSIAALVQHPLNTIMTLQSSGITEPSQLKGKTIGMTGVPSDDALLATVLQSAGLTMDDVETVTVGFDLMPALLGKRVDAIIGAYYVHEAILAQQQGEPVNAINVEDYGVPDYYELVLVTSGALIRDHADVVQRVVNAVVAGYAAAAANPDQAIDELVKAYPETDADVEREGIHLIIPMWTDDGAVPFGAQTAERWTAFADWMRQHDILTTDVDASEAFTNQFVEQAHAGH